jgi:uncharacterized protein (DUF58 family)
MKKKDPETPVVNVFDFDELIKQTADTAGSLMEFFRLNLIYYQLISGKGLEFDRLRRYIPGDDVKRLDWKVFARTGDLYTRVYKEERQFDIIIILDVSNSMLVGSGKYTKNEFGAVIAGTLAIAALDSGDNIGGGTFSHEKTNLVEAEQDYVHLINILAAKENYGGKKNWEKLTNDLLSNYESDAIVFIVSDFIDTKPEEFLPELVSSFTKVYGIMIRDPLDEELPKGVGRMYLQDPHTGKVVLTDLDKVRNEYEMLAKAQAKSVKEAFQQYGQKCFKVLTKDNFGIEFVKAMGEEQVEIY